MSLSIGIVGLPNVGKSTLFNALRSAQGKLSGLAQIGNFPFTTIEPNVGVVNVPDERLERLAEVEKSGRIVPATVKFVDIAGLIAGAHKGEGLGNKFLSHIREVDAIAMVVRTFEHKDVVHVGGRIDPKSDIETIMTELVLADLETLQKRLDAAEKEARLDKIAQKKSDIYKKIAAVFDQNKPAIEAGLDGDEKKLIGEANFLTLKPFLYVFNVNEEMATEAPEDIVEKYNLSSRVAEEATRRSQGPDCFANARNDRMGINPESVVVVSAKIESEIVLLPEGDQDELLREYGLSAPGLERLIVSAYKTLNLITFFTVNKNEAHAWNLRRGGNALEAAGKIHTDFEKKFIKMEVVKYDDFVHPVKCSDGATPKSLGDTGLFNGVNGGWKSSKEKGSARLEGKDYEIKDGDVVFVHHG